MKGLCSSSSEEVPSEFLPNNPLGKVSGPEPSDSEFVPSELLPKRPLGRKIGYYSSGDSSLSLCLVFASFSYSAVEREA